MSLPKEREQKTEEVLCCSCMVAVLTVPAGTGKNFSCEPCMAAVAVLAEKFWEVYDEEVWKLMMEEKYPWQ
jgi:hypothetical protein